jgi:hypothetical protein
MTSTTTIYEVRKSPFVELELCKIREKVQKWHERIPYSYGVDHTGIADGIAADRAEDSCMIYTKTISARCEGAKDMQVATPTFTDAQIKKNQWFMPLSQVLSGTKKSEGADWTQALPVDRPDVARRINEVTVFGYTATGARVWIGNSHKQLFLFGAIRKKFTETQQVGMEDEEEEEEKSELE